MLSSVQFTLKILRLKNRQMFASYKNYPVLLLFPSYTCFRNSSTNNKHLFEGNQETKDKLTQEPSKILP